MYFVSSCTEELYDDVPEPVPDYLEEEDFSELPQPPPPICNESFNKNILTRTPAVPTSPSAPNSGGMVIGVKNDVHTSSDDDDQIQRRKMYNPCLESKERQELHRELLLNYKL